MAVIQKIKSGEPYLNGRRTVKTTNSDHQSFASIDSLSEPASPSGQMNWDNRFNDYTYYTTHE